VLEAGLVKVLVADDNPLTLHAVQVSLELAGFEVVATTDPRSVLELARAERVDAAVLDVVMPEMSGFDVLRELRADAATEGVPVVFLSGLGEGGDRVRGLREGADDYLVKPFEPAELALRLERLIAQRSAAAPAEGRTSPVALDLASFEAHVREGSQLREVSLGRYQIQAVLGEGATGTVFRGWDTKLQRAVALKTIRLNRAVPTDRGEMHSGLLREAVTAARFQHPHIVAVYDLEEAPDLAFIIMEFVNGMSLDAYLALGGPLEPESAAVLGLAVATALEAAHGERVVHHDLKPGNVLLGRDGSVKVSDFGIAVFLSSVLARPGEAFGTPGYMPPEFLTGGGYDERGDLFALGATLYACLTGASPFVGATLDEIIRNTIEREPARPRRLAPECPPELDDLVMGLLVKERRRRPASAAQTARALGRIVQAHGARWAPSMAVMESALRPARGRALSTVVKTAGAPE
jgi:DNA-binding response OmpR family regulator